MGSPLPRGFAFRYISDTMVAIVRGRSDRVYAAARVGKDNRVAEQWAIQRFYATYEFLDGDWQQVRWDTVIHTEEER